MSQSPRRTVRRSVTGLVTAALVASGLTVVAVNAPSAAALSARVSVVRSASNYGKSRGYKVGIAVLDTKTGQLVGNSSKRSTFASESVVKVLIAAKLITQGRMKGYTSKRAKRMIACSNDGIANSFYGGVGGDSLVSWAKKRFKVPTLGSGPIRGGWWGSNRITAEGLVRLYAKLKANKKIGPWLLRAMHAHTKRGCDGFDQSFGLPRASRNVAVKQGWGSDYSYRTPNASQNSTGFVNGDRYAVAILARGRASTYGSKLGNAMTAIAKRLLPGGRYPSAAPVTWSLSSGSGSTIGRTPITIRGHDLAGATKVTFGGVKATIRRSSARAVLVSTPAHARGRVAIVVYTRYGRSSGTLRFTFIAPPAPKPSPKPSPTTTGPQDPQRQQGPPSPQPSQSRQTSEDSPGSPGSSPGTSPAVASSAASG